VCRGVGDKDVRLFVKISVMIKVQINTQSYFSLTLHLSYESKHG
jgi:hypothetical protein